MKYARLYTSPDGESHFEDVEVTVTAADFAPPAPPLYVSAFDPATRVGLLAGPAGWRGDSHPTPRRQFMACLSGTAHVQASDGGVRHLNPGDVILLEDLTGKGHVSWTDSDAGAELLVIQLPDEPHSAIAPLTHRRIER